MIIKSYPPDYSSVNDPLVWVLYDANAADVTKVSYKYVISLYVGGSLIYYGRVYPDPVNSFGIFDLSATIRSYVNPTFTPVSGLVAQVSTSGLFCTPSVVIQVQEEYNGSTGAVVLTDSTRVFFNHYNYRGEDQTSILPFANKPVTNRGLILDINRTAAYYFIPYFSTNATPFNVVINGVTTVVTPAVNSCQLINIAPAANSIGAGVDSYTVVMAGITYTVNVVCKGMWTNYTLHFMNKYGGFESMLFNKPRKRTVDIVKKEFNQLPYRVDSAGTLTVRNGNILHEQRTSFASNYNEKLKIQTDDISDIDYTWLAQMNASPMVYLEDNGIFYPVAITSSSYEYREYIVDRLTTLSLDIEFMSQGNTQYR